MKKKNFLVAAYLLVAGGMIGFTSCSNEEVIPNGGNGQDVQVLTLRVASSGDGLTTREGRPLLSSAADQSIDQVALYFVKDGKVALKKWVSWAGATDYADGKQLEIALKSDNGQKLTTAGVYKVYAVGYSNASKYTFTPAAMTDDNGNIFTESGDVWDAKSFKANMTDPKFAEEVFAGELEVTVEADGSFKKQADGKKQAITLHRQVAGATGYFDNVPVAVDGKNAVKVRLVASARNATVKFENFNSAFTNSAAGNIQYIVNGADAAAKDAVFANGKDAFLVYEIDLSQWFKKDPAELGADYKGYDYNKDGFLGSDDVKQYLKDQGKDAATATIDDYAAVWTNPNKNLMVGDKKYTQSVYRGTVFGAQFVVPFAKVDGQNTLQLQVIDKDGAILKYWNINVDKTHLQGDAVAGAGEAFDTDKKVFNIFRNHMYSVGMKANNTTPDKPDVGPTDPDPEKPDPGQGGGDEEKPQDLSKGQDLVIYVNDNWEVIHNMEID